jgi:hypothetical protein
MNALKVSLTRWHLRSFLWVCAVFAVLVLVSVSGFVYPGVSGLCFSLRCWPFFFPLIFAVPVLIMGIFLQKVSVPDRGWLIRMIHVAWVFAWTLLFLALLWGFGHGMYLN